MEGNSASRPLEGCAGLWHTWHTLKITKLYIPRRVLTIASVSCINQAVVQLHINKGGRYADCLRRKSRKSPDLNRAAKREKHKEMAIAIGPLKMTVV